MDAGAAAFILQPSGVKIESEGCRRSHIQRRIHSHLLPHITFLHFIFAAWTAATALMSSGPGPRTPHPAREPQFKPQHVKWVVSAVVRLRVSVQRQVNLYYSLSDVDASIPLAFQQDGPAIKIKWAIRLKSIDTLTMQSPSSGVAFTFTWKQSMRNLFINRTVLKSFTLVSQTNLNCAYVRVVQNSGSQGGI